MKNLLLLPALSVLALLFGACDGKTIFTKTVTNNTTDTITLETFTSYDMHQTHTILPGEEAEIYWYANLGQYADENYTCTDEIDSVYVTITNNLHLKKNFMNPDNWMHQSDGGRKSAFEHCKFEINEEDIE